MLTVLGFGCAPDTSQGRKFERLGQYAPAYESYSKALASNAGDSAAAAGLKRTAPRAVEYWQGQAFESAQAGQWQRSAQCHLKVLQIQPNENNSLLSLRELARLHPAQAELASAEQLRPGTGGVEDQLEVASAGAAEAIGLGPRAGGPEAAAPERVRPEPPAPAPGAELAVRPPIPPTTRPRLVEKRAGGVEPPRPTTAAPPKLQPAEPAPVVEAAGPKLDPYKQQPAIRYEDVAATGELLQVARLSKKDKRYYEVASFYGGLSLKLRGTDDDPDHADAEVYYGSRKLARFKKLIPNSVISAVAANGRVYELVVLDVTDKTQTLTVGLRAAK